MVKSKVLKFSVRGEQEPLMRMRLGSGKLEEVSQFKYMGSMVSMDCGMEGAKAIGGPASL